MNTETTHDDYAAKRLRHILRLLNLPVPLDDAEMMGEGLFVTLGMVRRAVERASHDLCELRHDREMLAQALRGLLADPTEEAKQFARLALGDRT